MQDEDHCTGKTSENPSGALVVLDRDSGAVLGSVTLPGEPDVVLHDPALARLYVAIGSPGVVSVIDDQCLKILETLVTESGVHTHLLEPGYPHALCISSWQRARRSILRTVR